MPNQTRNTSFRLKSNKKLIKSLSLNAFIAISILLCLTSMITIARLHLFDSIPYNAQQFYISTNGLSSFEDIQVTPTQIENLTFFSILTEFSLESNYLFPLLLQFTAIFIIILKWPCDKIYLTLLVSMVGISLGFFGIWLKPEDFFTYKLTYFIHCLLIVPLQITSAFGLIKLIPHEILKYKGFYACLMFFLPGLGTSFSQIYINWQLRSDISVSDTIYSSIATLSTIGLLLTIATFFMLYDTRRQIFYTLEMRLMSAIQSADAGVEQENQIKNKLKSTMNVQTFSRKETQRIFDAESEGQLHRGKKQEEGISLDQLGGVVLIWGLVIAIGRQLPKVYTKLEQKLNKDKFVFEGETWTWIEKTTYEAFVDELMFCSFTILMGVILLALLRKKKATSIQLAMACNLIGFCCLTTLLLISREMIELDPEYVTNILIIGRSSLFAFIIPSLFFVQSAGMPVSHAATILLLISWASQIVIRIVLDSFQVDSVLFILTVMVILCCYGILQSYKGSRDFSEEWEYRKIDQFQFDEAQHEEEQPKQTTMQTQPPAIQQ